MDLTMTMTNTNISQSMQNINRAEELAKCKADPKYFIHNYVYTKNSKNGIEPFHPYPFQNDTLDDFIKHRFTVVLKSRQMGLSWLTAAFATWLILFYESKDVLCLANKQKAAIKMLDKVKFIIEYLPNWMKDSLECNRKDIPTYNTTSIHLNNKSKVEVSATTEDAARGDTLALLIVDEAAFIPNAEETWLSLEPTLTVGGRAIIISTPAGLGGFFHKTYSQAEDETNEFYPICLGWELHPDRDDEWAKNKILKSGADGLRLFRQEYACQFLGSGQTLLDADFLMQIENEWIKEPISKGVGMEKGMWIFEDPVPARKYIVSADIAIGIGDSSNGEGEEASLTDFSAFHIIDAENYCQVAEYKGKISPGNLAPILYKYCNTYNQALFVVENNAGYAQSIIEKFQAWEYPYMYRQPNTNSNKSIDLTDLNNRIGFSTNNATRDKIITNLQEFIGTSAFKFHSRRTLNESKTFQFNPKRNRYEASSGSHDDLMMSLAIGVYIIAQYNMFGRTGSALANLVLDSLADNNNKSRQQMLMERKLKSGASPFNSFFVKEKNTGIVVDARDFVPSTTNEDSRKGHDSKPQKSIFE